MVAATGSTLCTDYFGSPNWAITQTTRFKAAVSRNGISSIASAVLLSDQRMPGMEGTEFLVQARQIVPSAKRVLLTAYADTETARRAFRSGAANAFEERVLPASFRQAIAVEDLEGSERVAELDPAGVKDF